MFCTPVVLDVCFSVQLARVALVCALIMNVITFLYNYSELQDTLHATVDSLNMIYADPEMKRTAYRLHAVLVHQGEASGGHYWAYVRKDPGETEIKPETLLLETSQQETMHNDTGGEDSGRGDNTKKGMAIPDTKESGEEMEVDIPVQQTGGSMTSEDITLEDAIDSVTDTRGENSQKSQNNVEESTTSSKCTNSKTSATPPATSSARRDWLKCNDISITEVDWEEVKKESFGGKRSASNGNTSAYCLVYINVELEKRHRTKHSEFMYMYVYLCLLTH